MKKRKTYHKDKFSSMVNDQITSINYHKLSKFKEKIKLNKY